MSISDFAKAELDGFLGEQECRPVCLEVRDDMAPSSFGVRVDGDVLRLVGADETCVLHAVYTFLEQVGFRFEITGPVRPDVVAWDEAVSVEVCPHVKRRGIRQHLNFPMDISSYPLDEALEYIRNLARLRFNHISFHSYPRQWIDGPQAGGDGPAGEFFYGQRHDLMEEPELRQHIRNKSTYCIPEIEPVYDNPAERSGQAVAWLCAVMAEAKRCGMHIQFSFEPRSLSLDATVTLQTARRIEELYPDIDTLELITEETFDIWGKGPQGEDILGALSAMFGDALKLEAVQQVIAEGRPATVEKAFCQIGHNIRAIKMLSGETSLRLALGVYCAIPAFHAAIGEVVNAVLPRNVAFMLLPGHSSGRVAKRFREAPIPDALAPRSLLCSWIEFDGTMYLQQNAVPGMADLLSTASYDGVLPGVIFNHWRTAENRMAARYASEACIEGGLAPAEFYHRYAESVGIGAPEVYVAAMDVLAAADHMATNDLGNIGFCYVGCWGRSGLRAFGNWWPPLVAECRELYQSVRDKIGECLRLTQVASARSYLEFLHNRLECSRLYLDAMASGCELQQYKDLAPGEMSPEQRANAVALCDRALSTMSQYMRLHAEQMPDRGCEGTLISVYHTPPAVLKRLRTEYSVADKVSCSEEVSFDEPPLPIQDGSSSGAN